MLFGKSLLLQQLTIYLVYFVSSSPAPSLISSARIKQIVSYSYRETRCCVVEGLWFKTWKMLTLVSLNWDLGNSNSTHRASWPQDHFSSLSKVGSTTHIWAHSDSFTSSCPRSVFVLPPQQPNLSFLLNALPFVPKYFLPRVTSTLTGSVPVSLSTDKE